MCEGAGAEVADGLMCIEEPLSKGARMSHFCKDARNDEQ